MEKLLARLCEKHGLTAICFTYSERQQNPVCVFVHWSARPDDCEYAYGDTFDIALEKALAGMAKSRPVAA